MDYRTDHIANNSEADPAFSVLAGDIGRKPTLLDKVALALSGIFSPLIVPTYACAMAFWLSNLQRQYTEKTCFLATCAVFVLTSLIPLGVIIYLIRTGRVKDAALSDRRQRALPYGITCGCYVATALIFWIAGMPSWVWLFIAGAALSTILAAVINIKWKISAHALTMGGVAAMLAYIALHGLQAVNMMPWIIAWLLVSGMVGSARLLLRRHTPLQVYAGFLLGALLIYAIM